MRCSRCKAHVSKASWYCDGCGAQLGGINLAYTVNGRPERPKGRVMLLLAGVTLVATFGLTLRVKGISPTQTALRIAGTVGDMLNGSDGQFETAQTSELDLLAAGNRLATLDSPGDSHRDGDAAGGAGSTSLGGNAESAAGAGPGADGSPGVSEGVGTASGAPTGARKGALTAPGAATLRAGQRFGSDDDRPSTDPSRPAAAGSNPSGAGMSEARNGTSGGAASPTGGSSLSAGDSGLGGPLVSDGNGSDGPRGGEDDSQGSAGSRGTATSPPATGSDQSGGRAAGQRSPGARSGSPPANGAPTPAIRPSTVPGSAAADATSTAALGARSRPGGAVWVARRVASPPVLDGWLDDWGGEAVVITSVAFGGDFWDGPADLSANAFVEFDPDNLYVAARVFDDVLTGPPDGDDLHLGDSVELQLDMLLEDDWSSGDYSADDWQIGLSPGDFRSRRPGFAIWRPTGVVASGIRVAAQPASDGYMLEASIPWSLLGTTPANVDRIGFAFNVGDNDLPEPAQLTLVSSAPLREWDDPRTFGTLLLR